MVPDPGGALAQNPNNPQSWNLYAYVLNNPLRAFDPRGLDCVYVNPSQTANFDASSSPATPGPPDMAFYNGTDGNTYGVVRGDDCGQGDDSFYFDGAVDPTSLSQTPYGDVMGNVDGGSGLTTKCSGDCPSSVISAQVTYNLDNEPDLSPTAWAYALAIRQDMALFPTICSYTASAMLGDPTGQIRVGAEYNTNTGFALRGRWQKGIGPVKGRITVNSNRKVSGSMRIGGTYGATVGLGPGGYGGITSLGFSVQAWKVGSVGLSARIAPVYPCPDQ